MTLGLRILNDKRRWDSPESGEYPWLREGEIPADTLIDFKTLDNTLSIWLIEDDSSNLDRILGAFAATRKYFDKVDYILFDFHIIIELDIKVKYEKGNTPDDNANSTWHRSIIELSAQKVLALAERLYFEGDKRRKLPPEIKSIITTGIKAGYINRESLDSNLTNKVGKLL